MTERYDPDLVPWTPPIERPPSESQNSRLHAEAQRQRLSTLNHQQAQMILSFTAALQELHALLSERSNGLDDAQRLEQARGHVMRTLTRHGTFPGKANTYGRAR